MRIKWCPRSTVYSRFLVEVRLEQELPGANAPDSLQRVLGMLQVIEHSIEQDNVKCAQPLRLQIVDTHQERCRILDCRAAFTILNLRIESGNESIAITSRAPRLSAS